MYLVFYCARRKLQKKKTWMLFVLFRTWGSGALHPLVVRMRQQTQTKQKNSPANLWKKHFLGKKNKNKTTTGVFRDKNKNKNEELRKFILAKPVVNSGGKNILEKKIKSSLASRGFRNVLTIHSASKTCSGSKCTFNIWGAVRENYGQIMKPCQM